MLVANFQLRQLCIAVAFASFAVRASAQNILANPSFESGTPYGANCSSPNPLTQCGAPTPWVCSSSSITCDLMDNTGVCGFGTGGITTYGGMFAGRLACDGSRFMGFAACGSGICREAFQQTIPALTVGQCYSFSACLAVDDRGLAANFGGPYSGRGEVWVYADSTHVGTLSANTSSTGWEFRSFTFTATSPATTIKLEARNPANNSPSYLGIDNVQLVAGCCVNPPVSMVTWITFDEGAGAVVADNFARPGLDGMLSGGVFSGRSGKVGNSMCFDQGRIDVPPYTDLFLGGDLTIDAWILPSSQASSTWQYTVMDKREPVAGGFWRGYRLYLVGNTSTNATLNLEVYKGAAGISSSTGPTFAFGPPWKHVAATIRRSCSSSSQICVTFYLDGVATTGSPVSFGGLLGTNAGIRIGDDIEPNNNLWYLGCIDELEIFDRCLLAGEIRQIYEAGAAGKCKDFCLVCPTDFNCDNEIDFFDYLDFVAVFSAMSTKADFNGDEIVDLFDYLDFVMAFSEGC